MHMHHVSLRFIFILSSAPPPPPADTYPLDALVNLVLYRSRFRIKVKIVHFIDVLIVIRNSQHLHTDRSVWVGYQRALEKKQIQRG